MRGCVRKQNLEKKKVHAHFAGNTENDELHEFAEEDETELLK